MMTLVNRFFLGICSWILFNDFWLSWAERWGFNVDQQTRRRACHEVIEYRYNRIHITWKQTRPVNVLTIDFVILNSLFSYAALNTLLACSAGALTSLFANRFLPFWGNYWSYITMCNGATCAMVMITFTCFKHNIGCILKIMH